MITRLKKHLHSESGSAMILALIVFSLVGAASVYVMDMFKVTEKIIRKDSRVESYKSLISSLRSTLYAGNNCTELLAKFNPSVNMNTAQFVYQTYNLGGQTVVREVGGVPIRINTGFGRFPGPLEPAWPRKYLSLSQWSRKDVGLETRIREIKIKWNVSEDLVRDNVQLDTPVAPKPPLLKSVYAYIQVIPDHGGINPLLPRNKDLKIKIMAYFNKATGALHSCYEPAGDATFCTMVGGSYNNSPGLPDEYRCEPDLDCWAEGTGLKTTPSCTSTSPQRYQASGMGFKPAGMGNIKPLYICEWCNRHK